MIEIPTAAQVRSNSSVFGRFGDKRNLVHLSLPYGMFQNKKLITEITIHEAIAKDVYCAFGEVLKTYGSQRISELHLDQIGDVYATRLTTDGRTRSLHGWGIALDVCPHYDRYSTDVGASFNAADFRDWWDIWKTHGAVVVGYGSSNSGNCHIQFAS